MESYYELCAGEMTETQDLKESSGKYENGFELQQHVCNGAGSFLSPSRVL